MLNLYTVSILAPKIHVFFTSQMDSAQFSNGVTGAVDLFSQTALSSAVYSKKPVQAAG